jgi:single-strand DNA-binding protein
MRQGTGERNKASIGSRRVLFLACHAQALIARTLGFRRIEMQRNRVQLIGYVGVDPQLHVAESGEQRVTFTLATHETWRKGDETKEHVEWHRVVAWGKTAELCSAYLKKGRPVLVEGRLRSRRWVGADGVHHASSEIHLLPNGIQFLGAEQLDESAVPTRDPNHESPPPSASGLAEHDRTGK